MKKRVFVTGLGVVAPNGIGKEPFWEANTRGISGVDWLEGFDVSDLQTRIAAQVKGFDPGAFMPESVVKRADRFAHLGIGAAKLAMEDSGLNPERIDRERTGVVMGSGLGGTLFHEEQMIRAMKAGSHKVAPICVPKITPNAVAAHVAIEYGLLGPNYVVSTACASGSNAVGEAFRKIQYGEADVMVSGGTEAPLTEYTFAAFYGLRTLSRAERPPHAASRPFDLGRDGFVMGEGGAVLVLEDAEHALNRGAHVYAEISGYGLTSGAYHMVMPMADGEDAARTMRLALKDAGLGPESVDYINAHGTSTRANDLAETQAIKKVFGDRAYQIPVSSTKSMIGHTIGAAGAFEAVVSCLSLQHQVIPPTINYEDPDPECDLDYVPNTAREGKLRTVLSNSFGFGSVNACLVFRAIE
jgi:3-oxoacyl-[acyl-carrier-protein] synthase II